MAVPAIQAPQYPIIYVRGYAGTESEVEDTVADPYMGFNLGATKIRQAWTGKVARYVFESPVVRLMKDYGYRDVYSDGEIMPPEITVTPKSIVIYRYYDAVSADLGGGVRLPIETFGRGLGALILNLQDRICGDDAAQRQAFKVHLVAHSMGGLVVRCFLQSGKLGTTPEETQQLAAARALVDKVYTYATPHNGIDFEIVGNVPAILTANNINNFNRPRMAEYLDLPAGTDPVSTLNGKFDPDRFFCLIGTNSKDYATLNGWSARAVGEYSDGLVRINNAFVTGPTGDPANPVKLAPRAYAYRSHSGQYGIVNSEEGYQNLVRFLFGNVRVDGHLEIDDITLPPELESMRKTGKQIRGSYHFEAVARVRGGRWDLTRRLASENSTVFRLYDELFPKAGKQEAAPGVAVRANHQHPELFSVFLSTDAKVDSRRRTLGFSVDLGVLVPEYETDGVLWLKNHYDGGYLFRDKLNLEATPPSGPGQPWKLRYGYDSRTPNRATLDAELVAADGVLTFKVPMVQNTNPGIKAKLVLTARPWS